jgi:uncharacterized protein (DUF433 family)
MIGGRENGGICMEIAPNINVDPAICGGTPCIAGTRIPVSIVISALASEMYALTREQIKAASAYGLQKKQILQC